MTTSSIYLSKSATGQRLNAFERRRAAILVGLGLLLILLSLLSLGHGAVAISPGQALAIVAKLLGIDLPWTYANEQWAVLVSIRAPRLLMGLLVGAALAVSGAAMQGLFRNPLADPALIGISSGAALAAVAVIVLQTSLFAIPSQLLGRYLLPVAAIAGGFAVSWLVYRIASGNDRVDVGSLLLAGIAINALAGSATGLLVYVANDDQLRTVTFWSMGSLNGIVWADLALAVPFLLLNLLLLPLLADAMNALLLGESEAGHLGFSVERVKTAVIALVAMGVGAAVALTGVIGFVGLVVPRLLRLALGPDHRWLLPTSGLLGALLLICADYLARSLTAPAEIPIGIVTGLLGSPFFLWLLFRQKLMCH